MRKFRSPSQPLWWPHIVTRPPAWASPGWPAGSQKAPASQLASPFNWQPAKTHYSPATASQPLVEQPASWRASQRASGSPSWQLQQPQPGHCTAAATSERRLWATGSRQATGGQPCVTASPALASLVAGRRNDEMTQWQCVWTIIEDSMIMAIISNGLLLVKVLLTMWKTMNELMNYWIMNGVWK